MTADSTLESVCDLSIGEAGARMRDGTLTSSELALAALARIGSLDLTLHAFIGVEEESALAAAAQADDDFRIGVDRGPLQGIPITMKDVIDVAGVPTTGHSRTLLDHVPASDSGVVQRLRDGGAVILGKAGTYEFAMGGPSFDLPFPPPRNPHDPDRIPGGSSSGSAAAVGAGMVRMALGTDSAGSIRWPAHCCGVVGFKPTAGLVSRRGVLPLSYTLDHVGPISATVEEAAQTMQVIGGFDAADPGSVDAPPIDFGASLHAGVDGLRLGIPWELFRGMADADPLVLGVFDEAVRVFERLGATVHEVVLPEFELFNACNRIILTAEAYAAHESRLRASGHEYGGYAFHRIAAGATLTARDYIQAMRIRRPLARAAHSAMQGFDALILPTAVQPAPAFSDYGENAAKPAGIRTQPFNVTGHPALSVPMGLHPNGMPLGLQIVGHVFADDHVLRVGQAFERAAGEAVVGTWGAV